MEQHGLGEMCLPQRECSEMDFNASSKNPFPESMTRLPRLQQELDQAANSQDISPAVPVTDTWLQT